MKDRGSNFRGGLLAVALALATQSGCVAMRSYALPDLRPCADGFAVTDDGWKLGMRHYYPRRPDPDKLPVVLCHGMGLNGTFWTITDDHLPAQLMRQGYRVFVADLRGAGASHRVGAIRYVNRGLRELTVLREFEGRWDMDDQVFHDFPAILDYVQRKTGSRRVNWVGHSLGGMEMFPFLELSPQADRVGNFVAMGAPAALANVPQTKMLRANRGIQKLLSVMSTGRIARPMILARIPGLDQIDSLYYTARNVDDRTVSRFYGYTLEDPGPGILKQLEFYLEKGKLVSSDRKVDYAALLPKVTTPTLFVAGDGDVMADVASTELTHAAISSPDKMILYFGKAHGHVDDYGHCDLVWSRHAPKEIFPEIVKWLDARQPEARPSSQQQGVGGEEGPGLPTLPVPTK